MANTILLKRDDTPGNKPSVADLELGEVGINTYDGRMYMKQDGAGSPEFPRIVTVNAATTVIIKDLHGTIAAQTGTTEIAFDDTIPLITEGTEISSLVVTPEHEDHHMSLNFNLLFEATVPGSTIIIALFRNSTCIAAIPLAVPTSNKPMPLAWSKVDFPTTTSAITYSARIGVSNGTWKVNLSSGGTLGGLLADAGGFNFVEYSDNP